MWAPWTAPRRCRGSRLGQLLLLGPDYRLAGGPLRLPHPIERELPVRRWMGLWALSGLSGHRLDSGSVAVFLPFSEPVEHCRRATFGPSFAYLFKDTGHDQRLDILIEVPYRHGHAAA